MNNHLSAGSVPETPKTKGPVRDVLWLSSVYLTCQGDARKGRRNCITISYGCSQATKMCIVEDDISHPPLLFNEKPWDRLGSTHIDPVAPPGPSVCQRTKSATLQYLRRVWQLGSVLAKPKIVQGICENKEVTMKETPRASDSKIYLSAP